MYSGTWQRYRAANNLSGDGERQEAEAWEGSAKVHTNASHMAKEESLGLIGSSNAAAPSHRGPGCCTTHNIEAEFE